MGVAERGHSAVGCSEDDSVRQAKPGGQVGQAGVEQVDDRGPGVGSGTGFGAAVAFLSTHWCTSFTHLRQDRQFKT